MMLDVDRLLDDRERGFALETTVARRFRLLRYEYCAKLLSEVNLAPIRVILPELDESVSLHAYMDPAFRGEFADLSVMMLEARQQANIIADPYEIDGIYNIPPGGASETFGFRCRTTAGWLVQHRVGPALLTRATENCVSQIERWQRYHQTQAAVPWASATDYPDLVVPPPPRRKPRVAKAGRRFILPTN